jgi:PAS domain S-box-containing protein
VVSEEERGDVGRDEEAETVAGTAESLLTFENAPLPLGVILPLGQIVMANRALRRLLGYEFDELVGKSVGDVVVGEAEEPLVSFRRRIEEGQRVSPERRIRLRCKDGGEVAVRASSVLVPDSQGAVRYIVARAALETP